jgi:hypothetical protein
MEKKTANKNLSLFKSDNQRWDSFQIFGNLFNLNLERGSVEPILEYDEYYKKCTKNCELFDAEINKACTSKCQRSINEMRYSNDFAKKKCPNGDPKCCKRVAKDNDFAYFACIGKKNFNTIDRPKSNIFIIAIIISIILFIIFLFFVFSK